MVNNDYQHDSRISYAFVPNKPFGSLFEISSTNSIFLKTFSLEFSYNEVWFTDQNSLPLEIEDRIYLTLIIKWYSYLKIRYSIESKRRMYVKGYGFLSFGKDIGKNVNNKYR